MKGVLLFAFNNETVDYYQMAVQTAKRVNKFLNLPVTLVTDSKSLPETTTYQFDKVIITDAQSDNEKEGKVWINKGRYRAYDLTPYDETLLLDTDYLVNSDMLLKPFELYDDFMCFKNIKYFMNLEATQEFISNNCWQTVWATVIYFKKTQRTKQIFQCLEMVQKNYSHYIKLYNIPSTMYRNDYGLTFALHIVNGNMENKRDYIPWHLMHVNYDVKVKKLSDTSYQLSKQNKRHEYINIVDTDFHMLNKENFMELVNE